MFASGEPVSLERLSEATGDRPADLIRSDAGFHGGIPSPDHGVQVVKARGQAIRSALKKEYESYIKRALEIKRNTPLSQAAMETLAIIAYNEPVTKSFVEQVRGVDSSQTVNNLVEKGLVEEAGRLDVPGRPITYQTTANFLRSFQLSSLQELPPLPDESGQIHLEEVVASQEDTRGRIRTVY